MPSRPTALVFLILLAASGANAQDRPQPDGRAPWAALTSSKAALKVAFEEVCLPAVLDGQPVATLATQRRLVEVKPKLAGFSGDVRAWRLASLTHVHVASWADGTCSVAIDRGDSEAFRTQVLEAVSARGVAVTKGQSQPAQGDGVNTAYCSAPPRPLVMSIIMPASQKSRRGAIFVNLFRARGGNPSFCEPALKQ